MVLVIVGYGECSAKTFFVEIRWNQNKIGNFLVVLRVSVQSFLKPELAQIIFG